MSVATDRVFFDSAHARLASLETILADGSVRCLIGALIEAEGVPARLGSVCRVEPSHEGEAFHAEVVGFRDDRFLLMPLGPHRELTPGASLRVVHARASIPGGSQCLGRVIDGLGQPIDGGPPLDASDEIPLYREPQPSVSRERITRALDLGIRSINGLLTVGRGMRIGIFAAAGVGKSTLLGQIARYTDAEVTVISLVGERRREVRDFLERDLGDALGHSVVVVSTSDEAPLLRVRAANAATAIAERFRDEGRHVLLVMDSLTRYCGALREIGLATGEPPTTRGYTPSVWSQMARLLERAGTSTSGGSITGIYNVLVEGDDMDEPVSDAARGLLDGHIVLSRRYAERGHFPAIDVLASISRVMPDVVLPEQMELARRAREALGVYRDAEDLISIGAYETGSDPAIDAARALHGPLDAFLRQARDEHTDLAGSQAALGELLALSSLPVPGATAGAAAVTS